MDVYIAKNSGFCKGVEYAVNTALLLDPHNAYVLGEIIHNADVVKAIGDRGLRVVETLDEIHDDGSVIFRSHGVPESFYGICAGRNIKVIDCTCGFVRRTQRIVAEQSALGKTIVIIGEPTHPEVIGLLGWCRGDAVVINEQSAIPVELYEKNLCIV
ncbi:MAG: 4-hydroxy-3-methylbut-2-enyl diphosphate reductase, partial [Clostridia bacterium]|nr:4-hydroxy-3-methylbut-2-enyl diphosphate reductase [Clostridia bacterium]